MRASGKAESTRSRTSAAVRLNEATLYTSRVSDAFEFCRVLLEQPNATVVTPGQRHWEIFEALCRESKATGNLVQDAWFAALAVESGCEWITTDRDYARFTGLAWRTPF